MWYDPVFKVETVDGRQVRDVRVSRVRSYCNIERGRLPVSAGLAPPPLPRAPRAECARGYVATVDPRQRCEGTT